MVLCDPVHDATKGVVAPTAARTLGQQAARVPPVTGIRNRTSAS